MSGHRMADTSGPILALIDRFADLLALAQQTAGAWRGEPDVDLGTVITAAGRFRDALVAASEVELLSVRLYHRELGGFITRVVPPRHGAQAASYSDEARDLAEEQLARMVDLSGEDDYLGDPEDLDPEHVAGHWPKIARALDSLEITGESLGRLRDLVLEEHQAAPAVPKVLPMVYRPPDGTSPGRRRIEARARRAYRIDAGSGEPEGGAPRSPTDQIFFVAGEPAGRSVTKVAGLPYRAAGLPWPLTDDGRPMTFLAQFCFAESRDLVGELPGDILLIFAEDREAYLPNPYDSSLRFEWHPLGLPDLIHAEDIPSTDWKLRPYFGALHRTDDEHLEGNPGGETKIGGEPAWIQSYESLGGAFLCELGRPRGVPSRWDRWGGDEVGRVAGEELSMGDAGCLYFFLRADGAIRWTFQCY